MKNYISLAFILFTLLVYSQNDKVLINYTEIISLGAPNINLKSYNAALFINAEQSLYVSKIDSLENGGKKIQKTYKDENGKLFGIRDFSSKNGLYVINNRKKDTIYCNARFNTNFIYKEKKPLINWKIESVFKKIEGIEVQKATTTFRGRTYIAWFSSKIPIPLGPWKLNGLPGLIIEAYDSNKEVLFLFKKIEYPYKRAANFPSLDRRWSVYNDYVNEKENTIERNLKYSRALGQQFDSMGDEENIKNQKNKMFIEIED